MKYLRRVYIKTNIGCQNKSIYGKRNVLFSLFNGPWLYACKMI